MALSQGELATLRALAHTFVPAADSARVASIAADALQRAVDPAQLRQLRLVLRLLEQPVANLATGAGFAAFRDMDAPARERLVQRWSNSPLLLRRSGINAFRKLLAFIAYADPGLPGALNQLQASIDYATDDPPLPPALAAIRPLEVDRSAPRSADEPLRLEADVIVVGSGAGGGVVAAELARAGRTVLVIEAGPFVDEATMPRDELDAYGRLYLNYGLLTTWEGSITMLAGSAVGGGTLVNWMTCLDAPADVRSEWATEHGLEGLDGSEWAADVATIERELGVAPASRIPAKDELIRRGAAELGWESGVIRRNATDCGDCGSCPFGCRRGSKQSGIRAHLADAVAHGAVVLDRARVRSVLLGPDGAGPVTGVMGTLAPPELPGPDGRPAEPIATNPRFFIATAPQVVLAAGALRSPGILQASRAGHAAIGRYLRLHPVPIIGAVMPDPVDMWRGTMQAVRSMQFAADEGNRRRYVIESAPGHLGLLALVLPWQGALEHADLMASARQIAPLIAVTRDGGEGRTRLTSSGRVRIDYQLNEDGRVTARHALLSMARLARAGGARQLLAIGQPLARHVVDASAGEARRYAAFEDRLAAMDFRPHRGTLASAHQMGTIRMGADPGTHPADERGRVRVDSRGSLIRGLYIADASTFPTAIGVNPMVSVMAMARRVSRTVLAEASPA
ncbi:MAG TPA: GMC family oxidoreductase N-terminal domain-containing protein [Candidatus Limnocylindrales bacterium]|nr:GMC family oxidoreductase N-terminal domain-containing protein [Candidatus Limnocylindrales bacterium]